MLRHAVRPALNLRYASIRAFSGEVQPTKEPKQDARIEQQKSAGSNDLPQTTQASKTDVSTQQKSDNFLIEFKGKNPSYDQIFEYTIDEKPHMKEKEREQVFLISPDWRTVLTKKYDFSFNGFKRMVQRYIHRTEVKNQSYLNRRHGILGPDLATAHFFLNRGGRARFLHKPDVWIVDQKVLPKIFDKQYRLIGLDGSNVNLMYEGLDNLILLRNLEELHLRSNYQFDDFCCDKLARIFRNSTTLKYLDLSDNPRITHRGIEALYKIKSLETLIIRGSKAAHYPFIELLALMFADVNPQCNIVYK